MKFKAGDEVRIKKDLIAGKEYGWFSFWETMEEHLGEVATIHEIDPWMIAYKIVEDDGEYYWTDEMIEPMEDPLTEKELEE